MDKAITPAYEIFAGEQAAIVQPASTPRTQSRLEAEREKQYLEFVRGAPLTECENKKCGNDPVVISHHFGAALNDIDTPENPVLDYSLEIMAAVRVYNRDILSTGMNRNLMVKFKYDPDTKTCYLPAESARAFTFYNTLVLPPLLKKIPDPIGLAINMENSHGYRGGNISDRSPQRHGSPLIDLMYRQPAHDCGVTACQAMDMGNGNVKHGIKDRNGLHTVIIRDI